MKVIYIAGPIKAETRIQMHRHVITAIEVTKKIFDLGAVPICVHAYAPWLEGEIEPEVFMPADFELIRRSDAVFLCYGWTYSGGSMKESAFALKIGKPTFDDWGELIEWLKTEKEKEAS